MSQSSPATPIKGATVGDGPDGADSARANRRAVAPPARAIPAGPEWMTQRWKIQVEAEARRRLKKRMRERASDA